MSKKPFLASFAMVGILSAGTILRFRDSSLAVTGTIMTALFIILNHRKNIADFRKEKSAKSSK